MAIRAILILGTYKANYNYSILGYILSSINYFNSIIVDITYYYSIYYLAKYLGASVKNIIREEVVSITIVSRI